MNNFPVILISPFLRERLLSVLHKELYEVLTMNRRRYFLQGRKRTQNLAELVRRVDSSLTSLSAALLFSLHEQQVGGRARLEEENVGGPHQDEVLPASSWMDEQSD